MFEVGVAGESADLEAAVLLPHIRQFPQPIDINQKGGLSQPKVHHRDEALPTRQHFAIPALLVQQGECFGQGFGGGVFKGGGFHEIAECGMGIAD